MTLNSDDCATARPRFGAAVRGLASVGLLGVAVWLVDPAAVVGHLAGLAMWAVAFAIALHAVIVGLIGWRWHGVVALHATGFGLWRATTVSFAGALFNQLLPTSVGGDVVRAWLARDSGLATGDAVASVVVDRVVGLVSLVAFVGAMVLVFGSRWEAPAVSALFLTLVPAAAAGCVVLCWPRLPGALGRWRGRLGGDRLARDLRALWGRPRLLTWLAALAVAGHVIAGVIGYALAVGAGLDLSLTDCLLVFPAMVLATMVPVSVAGWGVREGAAVGLLGLVGVAPAAAVALSIAFGATQLVAAVPGVLAWTGARHARPVDSGA